MPTAATFRAHAALSIIELLVVITIIGILASLLLPAINLLRESARQVACLGHVRQWTMAMIAYASDNRDSLCPPAMADGHGGDIPMLDSVLIDYLDGAPISRCPKDRRPGGDNFTYGGQSFASYKRSFSLVGGYWDTASSPGGYPYAQAFWLTRTNGSDSGVGKGGGAVHLSRVQNSSGSLLFVECQAAGNTGGNARGYILADAVYNFAPVHRRRGSVAYFDGHVACVRAQDTMSEHAWDPANPTPADSVPEGAGHPWPGSWPFLRGRASWETAFSEQPMFPPFTCGGGWTIIAND